ncbi:MAG: hypothetical protein V1706_11600 [Pseudomonadota bacterium]
MPVTIRNNMERPVMLRLNSGHTRYLAPGQTSAEIVDTEILHNGKLLRLAMRDIIAVIDVKKQGASAASSKQKKSRAKK